MSEPSGRQARARRLPVTIAWWYQQPGTTENHGKFIPQTVNYSPHPAEIISLIAVLPGPRCTTKHCPDRSLFRTPAVRQRSKMEGEGNVHGQRQAETYRTSVRGHRLELGTDGGSALPGLARRIRCAAQRRAHKSRGGFRQHKKTHYRRSSPIGKSSFFTAIVTIV